MATIKPVAPASGGARRRLRPTRMHVVEDPDAPLGWLARAAVSPTLIIDGRGTVRQVRRSATDMLDRRAGGANLDEIPA